MRKTANSSIIIVRDGQKEEIPLNTLGEIFALFLVALDKVLCFIFGEG